MRRWDFDSYEKQIQFVVVVSGRLREGASGQREAEI